MTSNEITLIAADIRSKIHSTFDSYEVKHGDHWITAHLSEEVEEVKGGDHYAGEWEICHKVTHSSFIVSAFSEDTGEDAPEIAQQILSIL